MMRVETFEPIGALTGSVFPPPDKSISHRAAIVAAMCDEPVKIRNYLKAADTLATLGAVEMLGARVEKVPCDDNLEVTITGVGLYGAQAPPATIDVGNAGTLMRILPGWLAGQEGRRFRIDGDESVRGRPVDRVVAPLTLMGAFVEARKERLPPLTIHGSRLGGIEYRMPVASAQVKSSILLAGLMASGHTTVIEPTATRDHTERLLLESGAPVQVSGGRITVRPVTQLTAPAIDVPGDISSAAFWITAATLIPGSELRIENVGINPTRTGLFPVLERMGASIEVEPEAGPGTPDLEEPRGRLTVRSAELTGTVVTPDEVPQLIDELPLVALLGCFAEGETVVRGAAELRHKESDRIATVVDGLRAIGAQIEATGDGFAVDSSGELEGGEIDACGDHRIAMLGAIAGLVSRAGVSVRGIDAAAVSYPTFGADFERVAG